MRELLNPAESQNMGAELGLPVEYLYFDVDANYTHEG
jgi:hypothetical protein